MKTILFTACLMATTALHAQSDSTTLQNIPQWVIPILEKSEIAQKHQILTKFNPFYFEEDYNGDNLIDIAFVVENKLDHSKGIMIVNNGKNLVFIVGAGNATDMGTNLHWMLKWYVYREKNIANTSNKKKIQLKYPAIQVVGKDVNSLVIYWTGNKYKTMGRNY